MFYSKSEAFNFNKASLKRTFVSKLSASLTKRNPDSAQDDSGPGDWN
jgi:hypothetical protein